MQYRYQGMSELPRAPVPRTYDKAWSWGGEGGGWRADDRQLAKERYCGTTLKNGEHDPFGPTNWCSDEAGMAPGTPSAL